MKIDDKLVQEFWAKVKKGQGCWEWTAYKNPLGYGRIGNARTNKWFMAHRLSYEINVGPIPDGLCVLHTCDNPGCVRPGHLFLGTREDNNHDRHLKGRDRPAKGERHGRSKITDGDVREMRRLHKLGWAIPALATRFDISKSQVSGILSRRYWRHID